MEIKFDLIGALWGPQEVAGIVSMAPCRETRTNPLQTNWFASRLNQIPLWITHVGFLIPDEEQATLRHASRMKASMRVRDHSLEWYLTHLKTYKNWKAAGIVILEPIEPGPRLSRLSARPDPEKSSSTLDR